MPEVIPSGDASANSIALFGNSHRYALFKSWEMRKQRDVDDGVMPSRLFMLSSKAPLCPGPMHTGTENESYWNRAIEAARDRVVVLSWLGNQHNSFLFRGATEFAALPVRFPRNSHGDPEKPYIPLKMAEAYFEDELNYQGGRLSDILSRLGVSSRVYVCGTPPPKSNDTTLRNLGNEPGYIERARAKGIEIGVDPLTPLSTRVALWEAAQAALERSCLVARTEFVAVPVEACEIDGSLKDVYCQDDATHANSAFGSLMWREVMKRLHVR